MFGELSDKLTDTLRRLTSRGVLTEAAVTEGLREIRRVLLEADVSYDVTRQFVDRVKPKAIGLTRLKAVSPGQQLAKLVHEELVQLFGGEVRRLEHRSVGPTVVMLVGLQGSGKTTTAAKLAARLQREQKAPYLVAADVYRPAAAAQLRVLAEKIGVPVWANGAVGSGAGPDVVEIVRAAIADAGAKRARSIIVDTAGRLQIDTDMMDELRRLKDAVEPSEILLVADGMTGQDAVRIAKGFDDAIGITGVVLTKLDGDARGGAALSIFGATGAPIKYVGVGEGLDALEPFHPDRMAGRILQQGDVIGLVEKAQAAVDQAAAARLEKKAKSKRGLDLADFLVAMRQMQKLGPLEGLVGMLPGVNRKAVKALKGSDRQLKHIEAIVLSMTPQERSNPSLLNGSRRLRIARGSGRPVSEVNRMLKNFGEMNKMMKQFNMKGLG